MILQLAISVLLLLSACSGAALSALLQLTQPPQRFAEGQQAYSKGDYGTAIAKFHEFLQEPRVTPYTTQARYYLGRSYYWADRYPEAIAAYQRLRNGEIVGLLAHYELCKTYRAAQEKAKAEEMYRWLKEEALLATNARFNPNDPFAPSNRQPRESAQSSWQTYYRKLAGEMTDALASEFWTEEEVAKAKAALKADNFAATNDVREMARNGVGRPTITYKEKARYTEIARLNLVQGVVVLNVVFTVEGEIKNIKVVRGLEDNLTENAIEAARKIRFTPATKDGVPVHVRGNLEYSFNLY
jgi:TonB family protein